MHEEQRAWMKRQSELVGRVGAVVDIGGRNINGTVRDLFDCDTYTAVDLFAGPGVDVVADATVWRPDRPVDVVVCCEVFEHTPDGEALVAAAADMLKPGGWLYVTCATDPREPHSTLDGGGVRRGEWYANVKPDELVDWVLRADLLPVSQQVFPQRGDLYMVAQKP
jgi:SAM-dependent methyltransferase